MNWLIFWSTGWYFGQLIDYLVNWLINWSTGWLLGKFVDWLVNWLIIWSTDWLLGHLPNWLSESICLQTDLSLHICSCKQVAAWNLKKKKLPILRHWPKPVTGSRYDDKSSTEADPIHNHFRRHSKCCGILSHIHVKFDALGVHCIDQEFLHWFHIF